MNRSNLTFLLPLKDRSNYTQIWLKHNLRPEYDYFVADGSVGDENQLLFNDISLPNLTYIRSPQDLSTKCYVEKMLKAASQIKTKYIMTVDNDDFINFQGVRSCINALEESKEAVCAGGPIYSIFQKQATWKDAQYALPIKIDGANELDNFSGWEALTKLYKNYRYTWYSIYRTEAYKKIWQDIEGLNITNIYLIEILEAQLTFCHGKYIHVKNNHYIRLQNPNTSFARQEGAKTITHTHKIYFDEEYRRQVLKMSELVARQVGVEPTLLLNELRNYYISGVTLDLTSLKERVWISLKRIHEIIPRKLNIFFSIEFVITFVNMLEKVRSVFKI